MVLVGVVVFAAVLVVVLVVVVGVVVVVETGDVVELGVVFVVSAVVVTVVLVVEAVVSVLGVVEGDGLLEIRLVLTPFVLVSWLRMLRNTKNKPSPKRQIKVTMEIFFRVMFLFLVDLHAKFFGKYLVFRYV